MDWTRPAISAAGSTPTTSISLKLDAFRRQRLRAHVEGEHRRPQSNIVADQAPSGLWYGQVDMNTGAQVSTDYGALDAFFPAVLALSGDIDRALPLAGTLLTKCGPPSASRAGGDGLQNHEGGLSRRRASVPRSSSPPTTFISSPAILNISTWARLTSTAWSKTAVPMWPSRRCATSRRRNNGTTWKVFSSRKR